MKRIIIVALLVVLGILIALAVFVGLPTYRALYGPNVQAPKGQEHVYFYIPTGASFAQVADSVQKTNILRKGEYFEYLARALKYDTQVKPGRYKVPHKASMKQFIEILASGKQDPITVNISNYQFVEDIAGMLGRLLEADSASIMMALDSDSLQRAWGYDPATRLGLFLGNTYKINWSGTPKQALQRFYNEYAKTWDDNRREKAKQLGLTPSQVSILATIVQGEVVNRDEGPKVAGLYLNRLKRGIPMESDPTLVYILRESDHSLIIRRVLNQDKKIDHPYNTYRYPGLPPGPIRTPEAWAIDAVLNAEDHKYIFMVASKNPDRKGYHEFTTNYNDHLRYARQYWAALDREGIKR